MYETILIPTDGSDPATTAARYGLALAERVGATVHVLSVVDPDRFVTDAVGDVDDLIRRQRALLHERARETVERVATEAPASVEVHTHVVEGRPARALASAIDDYDADLVAMGTHGRSGVDRYLFGSLAERTLRMAHVPVLAVREDDATDPTVDEILVATDGSDGAERAGDHAVAIARATDARLHALTVGDDDDPARHLADRAREAGVDAVEIVRTGKPHAAIREYAAVVDADLVVLGTHGRSGVERALLGSVAERTLRTATRPVLVVGP
jgi:nucleotide-binding universal stress UspA family protein